MSYQDDIVEAIWTNGTRTLDGNPPESSSGTYTDDVGYAIWTAAERTIPSSGTTATPATATLTTSALAPVVTVSGSVTVTPVNASLVLTGFAPAPIATSDELWLPDQLGAALAIWFDADDASTLTIVSNAVSEWRDKSGNNRHVSQATAGNRPAYVTNVLDGKPVVRNTSASSPGHYLTGTGTGLFRNVGVATWVVVAKYATTTPNPNNAMLVFCSNGSNTNTRFGLTATPSPGSGQLAVGGRRLDTDSYTTAVSTTTRASVSGSHFIEVGQADYANAQANHWTNGTQDMTAAAFQTAGSTSNTNPVGIALFNSSGTTLQVAQNTELAEAIAIHGTLSSEDREKLEGYLAWKWGLEANLPSGHPYENAAPTVATDQVATPDTASLSLTGFVPAIATPRTAVTATLSLSLSAFAPTVTATDSQVATPATTALTTTGYTPTVTTPRLATAGTANLSITALTPTVTVSDATAVIPSNATLTLTAYAPTVFTPVTVTPATRSLALTALQPLVTVGDAKVAVPGLAALAITTYSPTVLTPVTATTITRSLALATLAPLVTVGDARVAVPGLATLAITAYAPAIISPQAVVVTAGSLTVTGYTPTVSLPVAVTPASASLTINLFSPTVNGSGTNPAAFYYFYHLGV